MASPTVLIFSKPKSSKALSKFSTRPCNVSTTNSGSFFSQNDVNPTKSQIKIATSSYLLDLTFPDDCNSLATEVGITVFKIC